jgi:hypothetical protein
MRAKITAEGVLVPKEWFGNAKEVEILAEDGRVVLVALTDPIFKLGTRPVTTGVKDGSEALDEHLYS